MKALSSRGLPFRGKIERFGSVKNEMMLLKVTAEFDPFLATHIDNYGNPGKGKTPY